MIGKVVSSKFNCGIAMIEKELLLNNSNPVYSIGEYKVTIYDPVSLWESVREINNSNETVNL